MTNPATLWIVDRDPRRRAALAQLAGSGHHAVLGAPEDSLFNSAALPRVVVASLSSDFEAELDFVHRLRARVGNCGWILISQPGDEDELNRLFDTLEPRILTWPPPATEFRRAIRSLLRVRSVAPLSHRTGHESLSARFARWFSGNELHWLLRSLDPSLASVPVLIRGEAGTGRALLARYIHAFGSEPGAAFVPVFCQGVQTAGELLSQLEISDLQAPGQPSPSAVTIWLHEPDRLPPTLQRHLQGWIDFGIPRSAGLSQLRVRWMGSAGEEAAERPGHQFESGLGHALSGLVIRLAPLRDEPAAIERFALDTASAWCEEHSTRTREFDQEALQTLAQYPWPGNLRELERVVMRTLASSASPTIPASELRLDDAAVPTPLQPFTAEPSQQPESIADEFVEPSPESTTSVPIEEEITVEAELEPHEVEFLEYSVDDIDPHREEQPANDAPAPVESVPAPRDKGALGDDDWARILRSVAHEVRNPLVSIRTFSELLAEHHQDSEFRDRFTELVSADVKRIEEVVTRLQELSELAHAKKQPVDIANLLDEILQERRDTIEERQLLMLKELDPSHPTVLGDAQLLRGAFAGIFNQALKWVPERGDLYLASRHREQGLDGNPSVRVLIRFQGISAAQPGSSDAVPTLAESTLEFVAAQAVILAQGGAFSFDATERETVVVIDLPAPNS